MGAGERMAALPIVSVIIATYNRSHTLRFTLQSLLNQELTDFEAWVVGDSCTDDSEAVVRSFNDSRLHWLNLPVNSGSQAMPNNAGLRRARGRYIAFLGHDDLWFPWYLNRLVACAEAEGADVAHGLCIALGPEGVRLCIGPPRPGLAYRAHFVPPSCWLLRRTIVERCGFWNDPLSIGTPVDFHYWRRLCDAGATIRFCTEATMLKFPSSWFRLAYQDKSTPVQAAYWEELAAQPLALERRLLLERATLPTIFSYTFGEPALPMLLYAFRIVFRRTFDLLGRDEGWFAPFFYLRFQRQRRMMRRKRGLSL